MKRYSDPMICAACGYAGSCRLKPKGSRLTEWLIWGLLLFPGPIYSIWRRTGRVYLCPKCGSTDLLPLDTPAGDALLAKTLRDKPWTTPPGQRSRY